MSIIVQQKTFKLLYVSVAPHHYSHHSDDCVSANFVTSADYPHFQLSKGGNVERLQWLCRYNFATGMDVNTFHLIEYGLSQPYHAVQFLIPDPRIVLREHARWIQIFSQIPIGIRKRASIITANPVANDHYNLEDVLEGLLSYRSGRNISSILKRNYTFVDFYGACKDAKNVFNCNGDII